MLFVISTASGRFCNYISNMLIIGAGIARAIYVNLQNQMHRFAWIKRDLSQSRHKLFRIPRHAQRWQEGGEHLDFLQLVVEEEVEDLIKDTAELARGEEGVDEGEVVVSRGMLD